MTKNFNLRRIYIMIVDHDCDVSGLCGALTRQQLVSCCYNQSRDSTRRFKRIGSLIASSWLVLWLRCLVDVEQGVHICLSERHSLLVISVGFGIWLSSGSSSDLKHSSDSSLKAADSILEGYLFSFISFQCISQRLLIVDPVVVHGQFSTQDVFVFGERLDSCFQETDLFIMLHLHFVHAFAHGADLGFLVNSQSILNSELRWLLPQLLIFSFVVYDFLFKLFVA